MQTDGTQQVPDHQSQPNVAVTRRGIPIRTDALWPYYCVTIIYLAFGSVVLLDRWSEVGSLFEAPGQSTGKLPLNSIGDVLAGFFAPLAFLWLFAATQLQRTELRLQREELADTRSVLNDQRIELERAARESNEQTRIMRRTLDASQSREIYEAFALDLYFQARKCLLLDDQVIVICRQSAGSFAPNKIRATIFGFPPGFTVTQESLSSVDTLYEKIYVSTTEIVEKYRGIGIDPDTQQIEQIHNGMKSLVRGLDSLREVRNSTDNELIKGRYDSLELGKIADNIRKLFGLGVG